MKPWRYHWRYNLLRNLFPGKQVNAEGWCRVWVQKPA